MAAVFLFCMVCCALIGVAIYDRLHAKPALRRCLLRIVISAFLWGATAATLASPIGNNNEQAAAGAIASGIIFVLYHLANYCRNQKVAVAIPDDIESAQEHKGEVPATK